MPRKTKLQQSATSETFGARMARLRKAAGLSQRDLAKDLGVTQRMIAYYARPPAYQERTIHRCEIGGRFLKATTFWIHVRSRKADSCGA